MAGDPRAVPRTDAVLADDRLVAARARVGDGFVRAAVAAAQQRVRTGDIAPEQVADEAAAALARPTSLRPVINATGVLVHTNLGRAPLSEAAREALTTAAGFTDVEYDAVTGRRARRGQGALDALRERVPAAGDVLIVNNGAAAVVLAATALAAGKEIVISRGEMVEIGDGFRLPDLLISTGARLREVGTTNRTTPADYRDAISADTGFILKVHPSNFVQTGFVAAAPVQKLTGLGVPVVVDIGSGLLRRSELLPDEPDATTVLKDGAALVTCSGDKLLGGPQAGLILGDATLVGRLSRHPLARALRVDKLTLAALEATLRGPRTPLDVALHATQTELRERARDLADQLRENHIDANVVDTDGKVGGGGAPDVVLPSTAVSLPLAYADALRAHDPIVVGRIGHDRCLLDLRAVEGSDDETLVRAVVAVAARLP
jgi:L-seryl-tRNA(Ser) seleniumtransferase